MDVAYDYESKKLSQVWISPNCCWKQRRNRFDGVKAELFFLLTHKAASSSRREARRDCDPDAAQTSAGYSGRVCQCLMGRSATSVQKCRKEDYRFQTQEGH